MNEDIQKDILHELKIIKKLLAQNILIGETQTKQISKLNPWSNNSSLIF